MGSARVTATAALSFQGAAVERGGRELWSRLDLEVAPGDFLAVLGPNGSGKTTLLQALLGVQPLSQGRILIGGTPPSRGNPAVGYVPQQKAFDRDLGARGRDIVALGLDGHRYGLPIRNAAGRRAIDAVLEDVGATAYADMPIGALSGGEQQRLRIAQALLSEPAVLLCDEPLLSLDLASQASISALIDRRRREHGTAVVFVTHEINPVLPFVTRVLYLVRGRWASGTVDDVMTSERLTELYDTPIDVLRHRGSILVTGAGGSGVGVAGPDLLDGGHHH